MSNRVVTEGLLPVVMQHVRYMVGRKGVTSMSSVATTMLVDMVGEAGGVELAVPVGGAVLRVLLGGVARLGCSCGLVS